MIIIKSFQIKFIYIKFGKKKNNFGLFNLLPYNYQDKYFLMIVPPLLLPIYFNLENIVFLTKGKNYKV
jgi:hypothetical protein